MRPFAYALLALSLLIGCARLFTGVLYLSDEPTAVLVLKRAPAAWIERPEARDHPFPERIVLDREEPNLFYGDIYLSLMRAAVVLAPGLACAAMFLLILTGRRRADERS